MFDYHTSRIKTQKLPNILNPDHIGFWTANTIILCSWTNWCWIDQSCSCLPRPFITSPMITLPARTTSEALPAALATQVHYRLPEEQGTPLTPSSPIIPYASLLISSLVKIPCLYPVETKTKQEMFRRGNIKGKKWTLKNSNSTIFYLFSTPLVTMTSTEEENLRSM